MPAIIFVFLVILLQRANTNLIQSVNPLFVKYVLGMNLFYVGVATAVYAFSTLAVRYLISIRVKPQDISKFVIIGLSLFCLSIAGYFFSAGFFEFLIFVVMSGFATAIIMPFLLSLVHLVSDKAVIEKNLTVYSLMLSLALVFGPLLGSALLSVSSIRYIYIMLLGFAALALFFAVKIHIKAKDSIQKRMEKEAEAEAGRKSKSGSVSGLLKNRDFMEVIFYNTAFSICFASIVALGGVFAKDNFHVKYFEITLLFSLFFISSLIARLVLLYYTKKGIIKNKIKILNISILISSFSFVLIVLSKNLDIYALSLILLGIPHALIFPIGTMRISEAVSMKDMVAANTIYQSNFDLGGIIGPFFLSYIGEIYSIRFVFEIIAVFLFLAFITGKIINKKSFLGFF
ncbi:MAG: MFS transporter [bacterium]